MDRKEKILKHIDKCGLGLEIGPSHSPIAPKREGYRVQVLDHASREELVAKYKKHSVDVDKIEEVDYVWQGEAYSTLTGNAKHYDWIIASHVIEHTPDLITFLNDCDAILKNDGVISLAVPDKRYCFDHYRPLTGISKIIDSHSQKLINHTTGTAAEFYLNAVSRSGEIAWACNIAGEDRFLYPEEEALQKINEAVGNDSYLDVHAWSFVPHSFRLIIHDLFFLGLIPLREVGYYPTAGCEFYITLGRGGAGCPCSRIELLKRIESEEKYSFGPKERFRHLFSRGWNAIQRRVISRR